MTIYSGRLQL